MKTFVVCSETDCGLAVIIVAARDEKRAKKIARDEGAGEDCRVYQLKSSKKEKVLFSADNVVECFY